MKVLRSAALVALLAVWSAASASGGDQFKITAPSGWVKIDQVSGTILAMWGEPHPAGFRQSISITDESFAGTLPQYVAAMKGYQKSTTPDIQFGPAADVVTCIDHPAMFLSWKSAAGGHKLVMEQVLSVWYGRGYTLTYAREQGEAASDDARSALASLCVRQHK